MDEETLMAAYARGDDRAFTALFDRLAPRIRWFFLRSFGDDALSDDLTQQTFLRLHRARESYRAGDRVRPWVLSIAGHLRRDELRRRARKPEDELTVADHETVPVFAELPDDAIDRARRTRALQAALDALPEAQRTAIHLHRFEGLSFGEIGEVLGCSEGAAKLRAFRGYERLREVLRATNPEEVAA